MARPNSEHLDAELRAIPENLANGLFPLESWLKDKANRQVPLPDDAAKLPWRMPSGDIAPRDLGIIEFLERLLQASTADVHLIERWEELERNAMNTHRHPA